MGADLTQHFELYRAVVSYVGFFNPLRAYSPFHNVAVGKKYPSILLTTGLNDGRVAAWHSLKMATASANRVLLRVNFGAGHGMGPP